MMFDWFTLIQLVDSMIKTVSKCLIVSGEAFKQFFNSVVKTQLRSEAHYKRENVGLTLLGQFRCDTKLKLVKMTFSLLHYIGLIEIIEIPFLTYVYGKVSQVHQVPSLTNRTEQKMMNRLLISKAYS
ncbi:Hypothetical_protein [Hexamita inflata]|uniref:Hypothetical_protein n=1 Tax=Hexamita inflata TaxID=28002 RepID=A0AA86VSW8_9EUKA|nr:Hypothetical protein HINF_LOCUS64233 [Hexamita inflata]